MDQVFVMLQESLNREPSYASAFCDTRWRSPAWLLKDLAHHRRIHIGPREHHAHPLAAQFAPLL